MGRLGQSDLKYGNKDVKKRHTGTYKSTKEGEHPISAVLFNIIVQFVFGKYMNLGGCNYDEAYKITSIVYISKWAKKEREQTTKNFVYLGVRILENCHKGR